MPASDPRPGDPVEVRFTKWGGARHWRVPTRHLGSDEHGTWLHSAPGSVARRPGATFRHRVASLVCVPRDAWWVATFYDAYTPGRIAVYVDVATPATWTPAEDDDGGAVSAVDLDLDVVLPLGGEPFVDDEDEFAAHRVELAYPDEVAAAARASADALLVAVRSGRPPFDGATARRWFTAGAALPAPPA